jgi:hypothetical protein
MIENRAVNDTVNKRETLSRIYLRFFSLKIPALTADTALLSIPQTTEDLKASSSEYVVRSSVTAC